MKSNVGHLEGASGIAGLIKSILMLENGVILPTYDFQRANSRIPLADWRLEVATALKRWQPKQGLPKRLSINSFGYGGTNAHAILEEAPAFLRQRGVIANSRPTYSAVGPGPLSNGHATSKSVGHYRLYVLSAADAVAGKAYASALGQYLRDRLLSLIHI